jgi:hypothetical protein
MKKALFAVFGFIVVSLCALAVAASGQPDAVHIERSAVVAATPADLWPYVDDFKGFIKWNPWQEMDPNQKTEFSEPSSGVGAWYSWDGNDDVGKGRMEHVAIEPQKKVLSKLKFIEPFESTADVTLALTPADGGTRVTWAFDSQTNFMAKAFSLFVDMDAMLGNDFEKGLANLSQVAEADAKARLERERRAAEELAAVAPEGNSPDAAAQPR